MNLSEALRQALEALRSGDPNARLNALRDCPAAFNEQRAREDVIRVLAHHGVKRGGVLEADLAALILK